MADPFIAEIKMFAGNFAPRGWAFCDGQTLSIAQNTALFSLVGTTYGGDGVTTFKLPDLRGRVPIHQGQGPGLSPYVLGEVSGSESITLTTANLPAHSHPANSTQAQASGTRPAGAVPAAGGAYNTASDGSTMNNGFIGNTGANQPFDNHQPSLCVNFIIALEGIFPSRN
jgi:microcystin-dependent protein